MLQAYKAFAPAPRPPLLEVREMIFEAATAREDIGTIEETLRWGEPAYVTTKKRTGSTIRLAIEKTSGQPALFFDCKTTLVEEFRQQFGTSLTFVKNRAILLDGDLSEKADTLKMCITAALSYHLHR
jgi:hypothetical protein